MQINISFLPFLHSSSGVLILFQSALFLYPFSVVTNISKEECITNIVSVANQKGGVGKSTTTVNLAAGLVRKSKRVLVIDADPQGNLTQMLGWQQPERLDVSLSLFVEAYMSDKLLPWQDGILHNAEGIDLLPANIELSGTEVSLFQAMSREQVLKNILADCPNDYDYILIDSSPSLGMLTINALVASDSVIIPVQTGYLPAKGLELLLKTINRVQRQINPKLRIEGVLLTMVDYRTNFSKEISGLIRSTYGGHLRVFQSEIPFSVRAAEMSAEGKSIFQHDPHGKVAAAYETLTAELLALERGQEIHYSDHER